MFILSADLLTFSELDRTTGMFLAWLNQLFTSPPGKAGFLSEHDNQYLFTLTALQIFFNRNLVIRPVRRKLH